MKVREVIPHIGPIPIVIPLRLFLDDINFPRIMLRARCVEVSWRRESAATCRRCGRCDECLMRIRVFFHFYINQSLSTSRKRKLLEDSPVEKKRQENKFSSEAGDILEREEIVLESEKRLKSQVCTTE